MAAGDDGSRERAALSGRLAEARRATRTLGEEARSSAGDAPTRQELRRRMAAAAAQDDGRRADVPVDGETLATIRFEPFDGRTVVQWVQPDVEGSELVVRFHDAGGVAGSSAAVQRDRLTDELTLCSARVDDRNTGVATVVRTDAGSTAAPLGTADLSGVRLVLAGQNGLLYFADLESATSVAVMRSGSVVRTERRTLRFESEAPGEPPILGVHAYVTTRAGSSRVELGLRIHNGAHRPDGTDFCGKVYYRSLELETKGFEVRSGDSKIADGQHVFLPRGQLVRRFELERSGDASSAPRHRSAYAATGASYFSRPAYGPDGTFVPEVPLEAVQQDGRDLDGAPVGPYRLIDIPNSDAPGGKWIFPFLGGRRGLDPRERNLDELRAIADRVQERMPLACFDRESGEPIWSWDWAAANAGQQPFQYDLAARQGIRRWDLPGQPQLPAGVLTGSMSMDEDRGRSINDGACGYESELRKWLSYDGQHLVRGYTHAAALVYWTGDALSADWIRMVAADAGWDYTFEEVGGIENPYQLRSLKAKLASAAAKPGQGGGTDREWAWVSVVASIACRIDDDPRLAEWCGGLLDLTATLAMPNGIPWRINAPGSGGNTVYWTEYGTPLKVDACGTFQVPMLAFATFCLSETAGDAMQRARANVHIARMAETVLEPSLFQQSVYHANQVGPAMSTWVAVHKGAPLATLGSSGKSNPTNYPLLYGLAFRATGDAVWLQRIEECGKPGPKNVYQLALSNSGFSEAFAGLAQNDAIAGVTEPVNDAGETVAQ